MTEPTKLAKRRILCAVASATFCSCSGGGAPAPTPTPRPPSIDDYLGQCPTGDEVKSVNEQLLLIFDADPSRNEPPACTATAGSVDLSPFEKRVYQGLLAMRRIQFDAPLPWTPLALGEWLPRAIRGIRFSPDVTFSFCCEQGDRIVIKTARSRAEDNSCLLAANTARWIAPDQPCGMDSFIALIVHLARISEGRPHTCGTNDRTINELAPWGVQYYLYRWFSEHSGTYLTPADGKPSDSFYRDNARGEAHNVCSTRFCNDGCPAGF